MHDEWPGFSFGAPSINVHLLLVALRLASFESEVMEYRENALQVVKKCSSL